jgi:hypothetical protein
MEENIMPKMPDFLIIGASKCGTTSLFNYIIQHPEVIRGRKKEIHFFNHHYNKGITWYRKQFPLLKNRKGYSKKAITGEATPNYLYRHEIPQKVHESMPNVKLIVLLRDPVERAFSHYQHRERKRIMTKSNVKEEFEEAVKEQIEVINSSEEVIHKSYIYQGLYVEHLKAWMNIFPKEQFLIIKSEELFTNPEKIVDEVFDFLDLYPLKLTEYHHYHAGNYKDVMTPEIRSTLVDFFKPYNKKLNKFLNRDFGW